MPEQVQEARVSAPLFRLFGVAIAKGRSFTQEEDQPLGPHVAVLSDELWKRRFGGDPAIIGKTILLSGDPYEIVGVTAPEYRMEADPPVDLYVPFQIDPNSTDQAHYFTAVARLKPGITLANGESAASACRRRIPAQVSGWSGDGATGRVQRRADARGDREQRAPIVAGAGGGGGLRAADCLRQCGESSAGTRHRPAARDRDPGGHRRRTRPYRSTTAY